MDRTSTLDELREAFARSAEVTLAGLEAKYYVRGAMDPAYANPDARDSYVRTLSLAWKRGPNYAAAFMRGWVEHRVGDVSGPFVAHRLWSGTAVQVAVA